MNCSLRAARHALSILVVLLATSCGGTGTKSDAPAFNVMKKGEVHSTMWQLLQDVDALDDLMRAGGADPAKLNADTVALLTRISGSVQRLSTDQNRKAHPLLDERIEFFRQSVDEAIAGAGRTPPNYYFAGAVAGSCVNCHDPRGGLRPD